MERRQVGADGRAVSSPFDHRPKGTRFIISRREFRKASDKLLRLLETIRSRSNRLRINKYDDFILTMTWAQNTLLLKC